LSICFQADGDLKFAIVKAVRRREPAIDFASARETELEGVSDPEVLERAAGDERVLVSHDRRTILKYFRDHPYFMMTACWFSMGLIRGM
jgi:hypothetical protein